MQTSTWKGRLESKRRGKDRFFRDDPRSPIPPADREEFQGLAYFPLDVTYRLDLPLREYGEKERVVLEASHGGRQEFLRWGEFKFRVGEEDCVLYAYRRDPDEERLFVPFRDETSGKETYEKGRYLDLEPEIHRTDEGSWVLDFNEAYNPWCAYSEDFVCPFAPPENWLKAPIRAGEKAYSL